jgi:hypothetical protein
LPRFGIAIISSLGMNPVLSAIHFSAAFALGTNSVLSIKALSDIAGRVSVLCR